MRNKSMLKKIVLMFCALLLLWSHHAYGTDEFSQLMGTFNWAKKYYLEGKYRDSIKKLEVLLTFIDKENPDETYRSLWGKVNLLLAAANEKTGRKEEAKLYYHNVKTLAEELKSTGSPLTWITEIDFSNLELFHLTGQIKSL